MRKQPRTKTVNQTFSIPVEVSQDLHTYVKRREMSRFVSDAIKKELNSRKDELRQCYLQSKEDKGQLEVEQDWEDTLSDGSDEW